MTDRSRLIHLFYLLFIKHWPIIGYVSTHQRDAQGHRGE